MRLYDIDEALRKVIEDGFAVDEETGEVFDASSVEALQAERKDKMEAIAVIIKESSAEASALKAEESSLKERRERLEKRIDWLKGYLLTSLQNASESALQTSKVDVRTRTTKSVNILDEKLIPAEYIVEKVERKPDKTAIRKALDSGAEIAGAEIVNNTSIQIK